MTFRHEDTMGMRKTRTQGAPIAALLGRLRTTYGADQRAVAAEISFSSSRNTEQVSVTWPE